MFLGAHKKISPLYYEIGCLQSKYFSKLDFLTLTLLKPTPRLSVKLKIGNNSF